MFFFFNLNLASKEEDGAHTHGLCCYDKNTLISQKFNEIPRLRISDLIECYEIVILLWKT